MWFQTFIQRLSAVSLSYLPSLVFAGAILIIGFIVAAVFRRLISRILRHAHREVRLFIARLAYAAIVIGAALWALAASGVHVAALATLLGALGLAVSLSLQDVAKNLVAGLYLLVEGTFRVGDQITVQSFTGQVELIDLRATTLRTDDGQQVIVPNTIIMSNVVVNQANKGTGDGS